ncbi:hypothetical protein EU97_0472 [Prochlorococcus marinus str. MIT 9311]|nr:hypothetical protein EU97_0472 [Prochlorococcus marinus str. MIT 9311]
MSINAYFIGLPKKNKEKVIFHIFLKTPFFLTKMSLINPYRRSKQT